MNEDLNVLKNEEKESNVPGFGSNSNGIMAGVLIVVGVGLVLSNVTGFSFDNWWVLFMFIPALTMLKAVRDDYQGNGRLTSRSSGALIASLAIFTTAFIFLFDLSWGDLWPVAFIFGGLSVLLSSRS